MNKKLTDVEIKKIQYLIGFTDGLAGALAMHTVLLEKLEKYKDKKQFKEIIGTTIALVRKLTEILEKSSGELDTITEQLAEKYELTYDENTEIISVDLENNTIEIEKKENIDS